jgi:hypothetical protein
VDHGNHSNISNLKLSPFEPELVWFKFPKFSTCASSKLKAAIEKRSRENDHHNMHATLAESKMSKQRVAKSAAFALLIVLMFSLPSPTQTFMPFQSLYKLRDSNATRFGHQSARVLHMRGAAVE